MRGRRWRFGLAIVLAILGAFWFEVDFSSSRQATGNVSVAHVAAAGAGATADPRRPRHALAALGGAFVRGAAISLPPWGVLIVSSTYLVGRVSLKRWSSRR